MSKVQPRPTPAVAKAPNRVPAGGPRTVIPVKGPAKPQTPVSRAPVAKPATPVSRPAVPRTATPKAAVPKVAPPRAAATKAGAPRPGAVKAAPPAAPKTGNWINRTVQQGVAGVGTYGAGYVYSLGGKVNGIGEGIGNSIANATRNLGQGVAGYGNNIKDQVGVGGSRVATGSNPLGMAGVGAAQAQSATGGVRTAGKPPAAGSFF